MMKDFAYFFLPFGGILAVLLVFVPTRKVHRACVNLCCLHLQLGPLRVGVAASICLYSFIRLFFTAMKLREVYAANAKQEGTAAIAAAAGMQGGINPGAKGSSSYQLRHERNLWIELFCLALWMFVWRGGRLLGYQWQRIDALKTQLQRHKEDREEEERERDAKDPELRQEQDNKAIAAAETNEASRECGRGLIEMIRFRKAADAAQQKEVKED